MHISTECICNIYCMFVSAITLQYVSLVSLVEPACCRQWPHCSSLWLSSAVWLWGRWLRGEFPQFHQLLRLGRGAGLSKPGPLGTTFHQVGWPIHGQHRGGQWHRNTARENRMGLTYTSLCIYRSSKCVSSCPSPQSAVWPLYDGFCSLFHTGLWSRMGDAHALFMCHF